MNSDAVKIKNLLESIGLPAPQIGESNDTSFAKVAAAVEKLVAIANAATEFVQNREEATEHIWYTNGDRGRRLLEALGIKYEPKE